MPGSKQKDFSQQKRDRRKRGGRNGKETVEMFIMTRNNAKEKSQFRIPHGRFMITSRHNMRNHLPPTQKESRSTILKLLKKSTKRADQTGSNGRLDRPNQSPRIR